MTINTTIVPPKGRITERELILGACSVRELEKLRLLQDHAHGATIKLPVTLHGMSELTIMDVEFQAIIALLIERHSVFLGGLDVELNQPSA